MKKIATLLFTLACALPALCQTAQEIVGRMEEQMNIHEKEGLFMIVDAKVPLLGTMTTKSWAYGNKYRFDVNMMGDSFISWDDGVSLWEYRSDKNEVEIKRKEAKEASESAENGDAELFSGITDGYDVSIQKETANAWHILCKKSGNNTDKDAPKTIKLVVSKGNYYPISLSAKISGINMTMRDISFGVSEDKVTFRLSDFPGATIVDHR